MKDFDTKWEKIYRNRRQLNKYPFTDVVSFFFKNFKNRNNLNILEVGCGTGNNLEFLAKLNHNIYGIDASSTAIKYAKKYFQKFKNNSDFKIGSFTNLPYKKNFFDLIINRAAITNVEFNKAVLAFKQCKKVLKKNGMIYSTFYSNLCTFQATEIKEGFYHKFKKSFDAGSIQFYNYDKILKLHKTSDLRMVNLKLNNNYDYFKTPTQIISEWYVETKK